MTEPVLYHIAYTASVRNWRNQAISLIEGFERKRDITTGMPDRVQIQLTILLVRHILPAQGLGERFLAFVSIHTPSEKMGC